MKYEQSVKDLYKIAGMLRLLTCMHERKIPPAMIIELEDAMERLELIGAEMMEDLLTPEKHVKLQPYIEKMLDHLEEKQVIDNEREPTETSGRVCPAQEDASDQ